MIALETISSIRNKIFPANRVKPVAGSCAVMIVDDNLEIIEALRNLLHAEFLVISCPYAERAAEMLTPEVRVVLLDIKMAGKDGLEVFNLLRERRKDLRIIFHSAYAGDEKKRLELERLDHNGYLTKGDYKLAELLDLIRGVTDGGRPQSVGEGRADSPAT